MRIGTVATAARAHAMRTSWPPPSPVLPSSSITGRCFSILAVVDDTPYSVVVIIVVVEC